MMADSTVSEILNSEEWCIDCSDDEKYEINDKWITVEGMQIPSADDIASLHEVLCMDRVIALEWRSVGRRPPTPEGGHIVQPQINLKTEIKSDDFFDFDMDDLSTSQPSLPVRRREGELKGGARKKTASFDGVVSNMKRLWKLENESPQSTTANSSPPTTPVAPSSTSAS